VAGLTIAGLAKDGGVGVETIRYYQRRGLLDVPESPGVGAVRRYGSADARKLRFIRAAQAAGFTLEQIGELITLDTTHDRARARELAQSRVASLNAQIAVLTTARDSLRKLARECGEGSAGPCPILESFEA
jgi:MerR family mercuric resistance operon transcriptional regulator